MKKSKKKTISDIERDVKYCIDVLKLNDEQMGMVLRCTEELGNFSVQYFMEEFILDNLESPEHILRYADPNYLKINWRLN